MTKTTLRELLKRTWRSRSRGWARFARYLTGDQADAADVISEAMLKTLKADPSLETERETDNYILRAIHNTFFSQRARRKARQRVLEELRLHGEEHAASPLRRVLEAEEVGRLDGIAQLVKAQRKKLSPELRKALALYYDRGLKYREIAEIEQVSVTTAHDRVQRALDVLGQAIPDEDEP